MHKLAYQLKTYVAAHPLVLGNSNFETILGQLFPLYQEFQESDSPEIKEGFMQLDSFLENLPLDDNNTVFSSICNLCAIYERKAFKDGLLYGAQLMLEIQ